MTRIVRSHYRYKRPPRRKKAVALVMSETCLRHDVPAVVTIDRKTRRRISEAKAGTSRRRSEPHRDDGQDNEQSDHSGGREHQEKQRLHVGVQGRESSHILTARRPGKRYADVPEMTAEEHQRRGDLADAMMAEFKRVIAEKIRS